MKKIIFLILLTTKSLGFCQENKTYIYRNYSSSIIRKELCYWNSNLDGIEDYDLWIRLRKDNKKFFNCKAILVKHRIHTSSAFNAKGNNDKVSDLLKTHNLVREENKSENDIKYSHLIKRLKQQILQIKR